MRVFHLTPVDFHRYVGGGERYVANVVSAIRRAADNGGFPVEQRIVTIGDIYKAQDINGTVLVSLPEDDVKLGLMDRTSSYLGRELDGADIVHVHQILTTFGLHAVLSAKSRGLTVVGTDLGGGQNPIMTRAGLALIDGTISISAYAARLLAPYYNGPDKVVIGPIDTHHFHPGARTQRKTLKRLVAVSRILPHKGIDQAIRALPDGVELRMIGKVYDERYYNDLKALAGGKRVTFLHDVDDNGLVDEYREADAFIQCSTYIDMYGTKQLKAELMGLTALEAMACGLPAIVSNCASLPELIREGETGFMFKDVADLRRLLERLAAGGADLPAISETARDHVESNYSYLTVGSRLLSFYNERLGHPS
jgi:glycosyltransferase involved in cell wall biosynthesis